MGLGTLRDNQLIKWRDRLFKLVGRLPNGHWHMIDIGSGLIDTQSDEDLWRALEMRELVFVCESDRSPSNRDRKLQVVLTQNAELCAVASEDIEKRKNAVLRWKYVCACKGLTIKEIEKVVISLRESIGWPNKAPHPNSIWNWKNKAEFADDPISALIDRDDRKGRYEDRYPPEVMDLAREIRDKHYLKRNPRITIAKAVEKLGDRVVLENQRRPESDRLGVPKRKLFERIVAEIPEVEVWAKRYGQDSAMNRFRLSLGGVAAEKPLDRCEVDHTTLAIILCDEEFVPWGRASTSIALDVCCRIPTGVYWGPEVPSTVSLARCLRHSLMPKHEFMKRFPNVKGDWPCFGVSKVYAMDNGTEEWAEAIRNATSELGGGAGLEFSARKKPWHKPHIERFIRTEDLDLLQTLPGATMENILTRCDFNPKKDVLLRRSTYGRIFMKWLVDIYMNTRLASLGNRSPREEWRRLIVHTDQFVPTKTVALERLFLRKVKDRSLDHAGIEFDCLIYNSTDMGALRSQKGNVLVVDIYVSDEDLGYIQVVVPNSDIWIRVPCLNMAYASGMTRWQHEKCKKMKKVLADEGREVSLAEAREEIEKEIEEETKEFRYAHRKRRSRFTEKHSHDHPAPTEPAQTPATEASPASDEDADAFSPIDDDRPVKEVESILID